MRIPSAEMASESQYTIEARASLWAPQHIVALYFERQREHILYFPSLSPDVPTADPLPAIVEFETTPNPPGAFGSVV